MQQNELMHYGVKGMKWGKRKARYETEGYVSVRQARKMSIANDKARSASGERVTVRQANINARKAMHDARRQNVMNTGKKVGKVAKNVATDAGNAVKNKYDNLSDKQKKAVKVAAVAGGVVFAPGAVVAGLATKGVKSYAQKHPDKIAAGKARVQQGMNMTMAQVDKYAKQFRNG